MPHKRAVAICDSLKREMEVLLAEREKGEYELITFPGQCHKAGKMDCSLFCANAQQNFQRFDTVEIFNSGCFAHPADPSPQCRHCFKHFEQLCFYMLADRTMVDTLMASGAYLVTPGWLRHWQQYMVEWGLDQETAAMLFGETTNRIVLLDTGVFPESGRMLEEFAGFVQLPFERVAIGLGFFRAYVNGHLH
ncbi:MAG: DUF1638 domain-containing protein [Nitrospinae bacterium]|nr:DUF1638 domain-containing protein [Nitrospinota bacterium]